VTEERQRYKGVFGAARLSVARAYVRPGSRRGMLIAGVLLGALVLAYAAFSFGFRNAAFVSPGKLSSEHANLENDCQACHTEFGEVTSTKCAVCHEKYGDKHGVYTFNAHYVYRSNDFQRVKSGDNEARCEACHLEHGGRDAVFTLVPDDQCTTCHEYGSFNDEHPDFRFVTTAAADDSNLTFPHIFHVRKVADRKELSDVEGTCLYCHNPEPDGRTFEPIAFDRHCAAAGCHTEESLATPQIVVATDGRPGVQTLQGMLERRPLGATWAVNANPTEFFPPARGNRPPRAIAKTTVHHRDRWLLDNLHELRSKLYPDTGLADLLQASADVAPHDVELLYEEALQTLEGYVTGFRGMSEPVVQQEIAKIEELLTSVRRELRDPYAPLDETRFMHALGGSSMTPEQQEIQELVTRLTASCRKCHVVNAATIERVQKEQQILRRSEFDHRAHITQRRCLQCHYEIPITEHWRTEEATVLSNWRQKNENWDSPLDNAAIQNIPPKAVCEECHTATLASNACVSCHLFHPNKSRRSELLLYLD